MGWKATMTAVCLCAACCLAVTPTRGSWFFYEILLDNPGAEDGAAVA
jgi:hypothetical protein